MSLTSRGARHKIFLGLHKIFANLMRLILFTANRRNYIDLLEYYSFNADEERRDAHMSPERRAYLSQSARNQIDSSLASPDGAFSAKHLAKVKNLMLHKPTHIAITRRVKPGCEAASQVQ